MVIFVQLHFWEWRTKRQVACLEDSHTEDVTQVCYYTSLLTHLPVHILSIGGGVYFDVLTINVLYNSFLVSARTIHTLVTTALQIIFLRAE